MRKKNRKPFKDSKLFATIKKIAPNVLDSATDIMATAVPALSPLNNIIDKAIGVASDNGDEDAVYEILAAKEDYLKELDMYYADLKSARDMYRSTDHEQADRIADNVIKYNLFIVMLMVLIQCLVIMFVDGKVAAVITGIVGTVTGALLQERNTVINFFFGSSKGSKDKDKF
jgi:cell shape-determining protein MreC